jgi:hypothetical protein
MGNRSPRAVIASSHAILLAYMTSESLPTLHPGTLMLVPHAGTPCTGDAVFLNGDATVLKRCRCYAM